MATAVPAYILEFLSGKIASDAPPGAVNIRKPSSTNAERRATRRPLERLHARFQQGGQLCNVHRDPPRLILREQPGGRSPAGRSSSKLDIGERRAQASAWGWRALAALAAMRHKLLSCAKRD